MQNNKLHALFDKIIHRATELADEQILSIGLHSRKTMGSILKEIIDVLNAEFAGNFTKHKNRKARNSKEFLPFTLDNTIKGALNLYFDILHQEGVIACHNGAKGGIERLMSENDILQLKKTGDNSTTISCVEDYVDTETQIREDIKVVEAKEDLPIINS